MNRDTRAFIIKRDDKLLLYAGVLLYLLYEVYAMPFSESIFDGRVVRNIAARVGFGRSPEAMSAPGLPGAEHCFNRDIRQLSKDIVSARKSVTNDARANVNCDYYLHSPVEHSHATDVIEICKLLHAPGSLLELQSP
jgi:hypothetical protein